MIHDARTSRGRPEETILEDSSTRMSPRGWVEEVVPWSASRAAEGAPGMGGVLAKLIDDARMSRARPEERILEDGSPRMSPRGWVEEVVPSSASRAVDGRFPSGGGRSETMIDTFPKQEPASSKIAFQLLCGGTGCVRDSSAAPHNTEQR